MHGDIQSIQTPIILMHLTEINRSNHVHVNIQGTKDVTRICVAQLL